jgi:hypothetical protein
MIMDMFQVSPHMGRYFDLIRCNVIGLHLNRHFLGQPCNRWFQIADHSIRNGEDAP